MQALTLAIQLDAASGARLEETRRSIGPDEPFLLNVDCPGGCGGGHFLLTDAVETMLQAGQELRQGSALCQAASYANPSVPCGTKLTYEISIRYR